jgi:hypothetical protein
MPLSATYPQPVGVVLDYKQEHKVLSQAWDHLDQRLDDAGGVVWKAWETLSSVEIKFITTEVERIIQDPRYYLTHYHKIRTKDNLIRTMLPLWDSQEAFLEIFLRQLKNNNPIRIIVLKARQLGITSLSTALVFWRTITMENVNTASISDEDERSLVAYNMCRIAWESLPWWFKPEVRHLVQAKQITFDRTNEKDRAKSPGLRSSISFEPANSPSGALYSKSLFAIHCAEVSRYRKADALVEGVFGSLVNAPGSIGIMESTARGRHGVWYELCQASQHKRIDWEFLFLPWFSEPGYREKIVGSFERSPEEKSIAAYALRDYEMVLDDEQFNWRRRKASEFIAADGNDERIFQEFAGNPTEAFIQSGLCAFNKKMLQTQMNNFVREPLWEGEVSLKQNNKNVKLSRVPDGRFQVWEWPKKNETYYVPGDPSLGVPNADYSCIQVLKIPKDPMKPIEQVARWHGLCGTPEFARIMVAIGYLYNVAEVCPESNTFQNIISDIVRVYDYPNWYRWTSDDKVKGQYSNFMGWVTNSRTRPAIISKFREAINEITVIIRSADDIDECYDFGDVNGDGNTNRFEAISGHDDGLMALMIGYYVCTKIQPRLHEPYENALADPNATRQNTDWSPIYDGETDLNPQRFDYDML